MIELSNRNLQRPNTRYQFLATVSIATLVGAASVSPGWATDDTARPTVWIEMGGQLEHTEGGQKPFAPEFTTQFADVLPLAQIERGPNYSTGFAGSLKFQPKDSEWTFSASVRYGRSNTGHSAHYETATPPVYHGIASIPAFGIDIPVTATPASRRIATADADVGQSQAIVDFSVGRDVGLGLFGVNSTVDLGVRLAQFTSKSKSHITANPGGHIPYKYLSSVYGFPAYINRPVASREMWDIYHASAIISRSFNGIGPALTFADSIPLIGRRDAMQVKLDLGVSGAILFGRQKVDIRERVDDDRPITPFHNYITMTNVYAHHDTRTRIRTVVVPNIGGFAGLSFNYSDAKIKLGYRADLFFGAMDGGVDTRKAYDRNFHGPYASISIGLGG